MPTTYTHDAFGREVYQKLPEDMKMVIRKHKKQYLIGLHGPDIFFYYWPFQKNPIFDKGLQLHEENAREMFEQGIFCYKKNFSQGLLAYLLGFACHYMLDSTCHPFIYQYQEETNLEHNEIETHIDKFMLERDGKDPYRYHPAVAICPRDKGNSDILLLFSDVTQKQLIRCLSGMKFYTGFPVCYSEVQRKVMCILLKISGHYEDMKGIIIPKKNNPKCLKSTKEFYHLYQKALSEAPGILENLYFSAVGDQQLSKRFDRNYR